MTLSMDSAVRPQEEVLFRLLDDEALLVNLDRGTYFGLDAVGTRIWQLLDGGTVLLSEVHAAILAEFDVDAETASKDLLGLVADLLAADLVVPA